jgi:heat shock protein HslJ
MKKFVAVFALGVSSALILAACATGSGAATNRDAAIRPGEAVSQSFAEAQGKVWALEEIVTEAGNIIVNRRKLEADGMGDVFTLQADNERISGKGWPNLYFSSYQLREDQGIAISPIAGTLMMSIVEDEGLQEREYYNYLEQANQWLLTGDRLELWSETAEGDPAILIFVLR